MFEIPQASAERRLPKIKRLGRLPETSVLGRDDRPAQIAKFDRHRLGSSLLAALLAKPAG
jgi:hypothetical protein